LKTLLINFIHHLKPKSPNNHVRGFLVLEFKIISNKGYKKYIDLDIPSNTNNAGIQNGKKGVGANSLIYKIMKKSIKNLSAVVIALLFTGCQEVVKPDPINLRQISNEEIENKENPYDEVGKIHNQYLDYFGERLPQLREDGQITRDEIISVTIGFHKDVLNKNLNQKDLIPLLEVYAIMERENKKGTPKPVFLRDICKWIPSFCDTWQFPLPELPFNFLISSEPSNKNDWEEARKNIIFSIENLKSYEQKSLKTLKGENLKLALEVSAVARYSSIYWYNVRYAFDSTHPWTDAVQGEPAAICVTCDILGGDAAGAAVGALVGGVGAGPGAAVGSAAVAGEAFIRWLW
jgi:hypothetical protein